LPLASFGWFAFRFKEVSFMKQFSLRRTASVSTVLALMAVCGVSQAQLQRIDALTAPKFADQPPATKSKGLGAAPAMPSPPMPTPLPSGSPQKADLVTESLNQIAPLTPAETLSLRKQINERQIAAKQSLHPLSTPAIRVETVDMSPGAMPQIIRISETEGATLSFMDLAGRPWKVVNASSFNTAGIDIGRDGPYGIVISARMPETTGNISVRLEDLLNPVVIKVVAGPGVRDIDYSVGLQIPRYLPNEAPPIGSVVAQPNLKVASLMDYVMRTPPKDAKALTVSGLPGALAWQDPSGSLMLRTTSLAVSPNPIRRQSTFDGMTVYELPVTPYVLVTVDGQYSSVHITGYSPVQSEAKK
jgi:intracellular multiplication protein IcmK